jgi:tetratricopeptide (TPR) repeat protein
LANFAEKQLYIEAVVPAQIGLLKTWYSTALNAWGVELQRNGLLLPAQRRFNQALDLNSNNWVARVNLYCNTNLQNGTAMSLEDTSTLSDQIGSPEKLAQALNHLGPVDEPDYCFILGKAYQKAGFLRLAMQQLDRAHTLSPGVLAPEFSLAELYISCRLNDQATTTINQLESVVQRLPANAELDLSLAMLETDAWLSKTNLARAEKTLRNAVEKHPDDEQTLNSVSEAYFSVGDYTNADLLAGHLLEREPDYVPALLVRSGILIKTRQADMAIPVLNHVLSLTNSLQAKLNRAIAYAQTRNFSAAKLDYLELEISMPDNFLAEYGLAQMAEMQHDTNQAIHYLNICLSKVPPGSAQWSTIQTVLESLHPSISKN